MEKERYGWPLSKHTHSHVKAKCLQLICSHLTSYMLVCKQWQRVMLTHDEGKWFTNMARRLYHYAYGPTDMVRKNWWTHCKNKVNDYYLNPEIKFWSSSAHTQRRWEWDWIKILLPDELDVTPKLTFPEPPPRKKPQHPRKRRKRPALEHQEVDDNPIAVIVVLDRNASADTYGTHVNKRRKTKA